MSSFNASFDAIIAALRADAAVVALVGQKTFTNVPEGTAEPYIKLLAAANDWSTKSEDGYDAVYEFTYVSAQPGVDQVAAIHAAVRAVLHQQTLALDAGAVLAFFHQNIAYTTDTDGSSYIGSDRYTALLTD